MSPRPPVVATGPYRRPIEREPTCERHPEAPSTETCARCGSRVCLDCLGLAGTRFACARCARVARLRTRFLHAAAGLAIAVAGAAPGLIGLNVARVEPDPKAYMIKEAKRFCNPRHLDLILSSLEMRGADQEIVTIGHDFAAECEVPAQTAGLIRRARARLASP